MHDVTAVVLAAGEGKRMRSDRPKVLHVAAGRPLLAHVLATLAPLGPGKTVVVRSARGQEIEDAVSQSGFANGLDYVVQDPPRGTGDAVRVALASLDAGVDRILVVPGDTPLIESSTLRALIQLQEDTEAAAAVLSARMSDPTGYGRVRRNAAGHVEAIVEDRDAGYEDKEIDEVNAGAYVFVREKLEQVLDKIDRDNSQGEYYLTDAVGLLHDRGDKVVAYRTHPQEIVGVNSRAQLARVAELAGRKICERWMDEGVSIVDPSTTYIDASVTIGREAIIRPFTFLEGDTTVGERAEIGPQARVVDSEIAEDATVSFAVVISSVVGPSASVGPFASLRPGTRLERGARLGTFVESKATTVGEGSKANHLAYLGDAEIGKGVNVGAGTITCNWDGRSKHRTVIDDDAYIGSDTMFVAPVHVGKRAATGAGSVVRGNVPENALAIGVPARILEGKGNKMGEPEPDDKT